MTRYLRFWGKRKPPQNRDAMFRVELPRDQTSQKISGSTATVRIYGPIDSFGGFWGISAKDVATVLDGLDDSITTIQVRLNSPGGEASEGVAIMNLLGAHAARTVAVVDGIAASAASIIAAGCDECVMSPGSQLMIHDPITIAMGDTTEMGKAARMLESTAGTIAGVYRAKAGGTTADWRALMTAETWYGADEAVEAGLADRAGTVPDSGPTQTAGTDDTDTEIDGIGVEDRFDLSIFNFAGRDQAPAPRTPASASARGIASPVPRQPGQTPERSGIVALSDESTATLRQRLGVADDADESMILAALDQALTDSQPQNRLPEGVVTIDSTQLAELRASAEQGVQARAQQEREHRERIVKDAIDTGRIAPARREAWLARLEADPAEAETLNALEAGLVPVAQIGNSDQHDNDMTNLPIDDTEAAALAVMTGVNKEAFLRG